MTKPVQDPKDLDRREERAPGPRRPYQSPRITKRRSIHAGVLASTTVASLQPVVNPPTGD